MTGFNRLIALLLMMVLQATQCVFADADDDDKKQVSTDKQGASFVIVMDESAQKISGLATTALERSYWGAEFTVSGKAVSLQPLLTLRNRYLVLLTEKQQALARLKQAEQNLQRSQDLFRHGVTAKRALQEQQLNYQTEQALVDANALHIKALEEETRLVWGNQLASWALGGTNNTLAHFLSGQHVLLQITLPADKTLPIKNTAIFVGPSGQRHNASKALFISETPQMDSTLPGHSYFFQGQGAFIKPGMRVAAWIPEAKQKTSGVLIPKSATIWMLDQLFVYVKTDKNQFSRRLVNAYTLTPDGYFVATGFESGEEIVTTGAQMLLSEEQRQQIPDEDD